MQTVHCDIHDLDIVIYTSEEEIHFVDDNSEEVAIFTTQDGNKYLKRYVIDKCDENCPTIQNLLEI